MSLTKREILILQNRIKLLLSRLHEPERSWVWDALNKSINDNSWLSKLSEESLFSRNLSKDDVFKDIKIQFYLAHLVKMCSFPRISITEEDLYLDQVYQNLMATEYPLIPV